MINLDSIYLQEKQNTYIAHAAEIYLDNNYYATLSENQLPDTTTALVVEQPSAPITIPDDWAMVTTVLVNGQLYSLAENPEAPVNGEFTYNPFTRTVEISSDRPVRSVIVYGSQQTIDFYPPLLPPPYPAIFYLLPLTGTVQIDRKFEEQPSAQFEFESRLPKSFLQRTFTPGKEIDLFGIGFRINNCQITEEPRSIYPDRLCRVSVSLGSKWENYLSELCFLRSNGKNQLPLDQPFLDPDCINEIAQETDKNETTSVNRLLGKINIPYKGVRLKEVEIPSDTPIDAVVNPVQLLQERLRIAQAFIRWSNSSGIETVNYKTSGNWVYTEDQIRSAVSTSYDAIAKANKNILSFTNINQPPPDPNTFPSTVTTPNLQVSASDDIALSFEYPNTELTGKFAEPKEKEPEKEKNQDTKPRYVKKDLKRETRIDGDERADRPLEGVEAISTMSLCFDIGGQTKTRSTVTEEGGATIETIDETWGFAFRGVDIYNEDADEYSDDPYSGNPNHYWQRLRYIKTTYNYDSNFGYLLSTNITGYNTVRYKQESAQNPETIDLEPEDPDYSLYSFFRIPITGGSQRLLRLMPEYTSATDDDFSEKYKVCNRDGTSSIETALNPNYAPPYYVEYEKTETVGYRRRRNPENDDRDPNEGDKLLPDLIVGEESSYEVFTQVTPAEYAFYLEFDNQTRTFVSKRGELISPQKFVKFIKKFNAQGQAIATAVEETSTEEGTGELPLAQRRPALYTKEERDTPETKKDPEPQQQLYKYLIQSSGYTAHDPINGSENFLLAATFNEAFLAAKCKLAIENWRNGFRESLEIDGNLQIKEGDRFNYYCNGEYRRRVVLSASTTLNILGTVGSDRKITAKTTLTLGNYVFPNLNFSKIKLPKEPKPKEANFFRFNILSDTLGQVNWSSIQSRRNPR